MKKNILLTILLAVVLVASILITGCSDSTEDTEIENPIEITISITYPEDAGMENITNETIKVEENATVNDALQLYCNVAGTPTTTDTTSGTVTSINNINSGDYTETATWQYKLNGEVCSDPSVSKVLEDGDKIEWIYQ